MDRTRYQKVLDAREKKNEKLKHASFEMETSTHFPLLMKMVNHTTGAILELGSGLFSTPLLHWMCFEKQRHLITVERHAHYMDFAKRFDIGNHHVFHIKQVEKSSFPDAVYTIVFIDHSPKRPRTRGDDAMLFIEKCRYMVLHDAGKDGKSKYGYEQLYPHFKYRYDWEGAVPHTTVLSNIDDLEWLKI